MIDNTKTQWRCPKCGKDGSIQHHQDTPIINVIDRIVKEHDSLTANLCLAHFDELQVKLYDDGV